MNKQSVWKRALSLMLAVSMSVGNIPTAAFAENVNAEYEEETELTTEAAAEAPEESEAPSERATEAIPAPETVSATEAEPATEAVPEQQEGGDDQPGQAKAFQGRADALLEGKIRFFLRFTHALSLTLPG